MWPVLDGLSLWVFCPLKYGQITLNSVTHPFHVGTNRKSYLDLKLAFYNVLQRALSLLGTISVPFYYMELFPFSFWKKMAFSTISYLAIYFTLHSFTLSMSSQSLCCCDSV